MPTEEVHKEAQNSFDCLLSFLCFFVANAFS